MKNTLIKFTTLSVVFLLQACTQQAVVETTNAPALTTAPTANAVADSPASPQNDFSTLNRVEYVLQCMQEQGGQNYDTLYHCVCAVDQVAQRMTYSEYDQAQTFTQLYGMGGERGALFRDPPESARLRNKLKEARAEAQKICFPAKKAGKKHKD